MGEQIENLEYVESIPLSTIDRLNELIRLVNEMNIKIGDLSARVWDLENR